MKLIVITTKEIEIDITACRDRINQIGIYTDEEKAFLTKVFDSFEKGNFQEAINILKKDDHKWNEYLDEPVYDTLVKFKNGSKIEIVK